MNLSAPFIKRPIATTLLALGLVFAGILAFNLLPVAPLPQVEFPTISIQASLPGGNPETMATSVATPLERQLGRIAGVTEMTSASSLGSTRVTVQFDLSRDIDGAARDVQAAINASLSQLPTNLPSNPTYHKVNPADAPIMILALTSKIFPSSAMYDYASTILQQKLAQVDGIGQVVVGGSSLPAVRVELNPDALNKYGISLTSVRKMLQSANTNLAKGQLSNQNTTSIIKVNDQIFKSYQYQPLVVAYRNNQAVKLSDVAEVNDSIEDLRNQGLVNGIPAIAIILFKQPNANVITTIDNVKKLIPSLKASIPAAIDISIPLDRSSTIRASLHDVELTLLLSMMLVVIVTYLFLGSSRAMIISGVAVPLSLIGTFAVMQLLGYSLDNLSLMALTIATGFVVDDTVVVLENIIRHIESGTVKPLTAALQGAKEVGFTVLSMSTSLVAVFIPIICMGGIVGRMFREFSITLSIAIFFSLLISLTVTPMLCAHLLHGEEKATEEESNAKKQPVKISIFHKLFLYYHAKYEKSLALALKHSLLMLSLTIGTILLSIFLYIYVPKGFFPQQDTGRITASIQASQDISFHLMQQKLATFVDIIHKDPAVDAVVGFVGNGSINTGSMFISLKPLAKRKVSADDVINRLRDKIAVVSGAKLYMQSAQDIVIGGRQGHAQFQYSLSSDSLQDLNTWTPIVMQRLAKLPGIADVNSDQRDHGLQVMLNIDHDAAARVGITTAQIDSTLYAAFGQSQASTMYTDLNQYHVVMEVAPRYWERPETLKSIYVPSAAGTLVPLSTFASFAPSSALLSVNHQSQMPTATLSFNLLPKVALGDATTMVSESISKMHLPATIHGAFKGTAAAFQTSLANEGYLILVAFLAVYIVLGILYESTIHPITILSTLPSAGVGALLALLLTGTDFSVIALIGIILLIGIVKKNAIMMVDFALQAERLENLSPREAIYKAAVLRFRPIMMTTMAALLGAVPLAFGHGIGTEIRRPLGITIIGGLLVSQVLTLYTTPVIYLYMERLAKRRRNFPRKKPSV